MTRIWKAGVILVGMMAISACGEAPSTETSSSAGERLVDSLGVPLGAVSSATVNANATRYEEMGLVALIEVQEDELLEFYEPRPGRVFVSGAGAPKSGVIVGEAVEWNSTGADGIEKGWALLMGDTPMPERLIAALTRLREQPEEAPDAEPAMDDGTAPPEVDAKYPRGGETTEQLPGGLGRTQQAHIYSVWCDDNYYNQNMSFWYFWAMTWPLGACPGADGGIEWEVCWDHVTGSGAAWRTDWYTYSNVCTYSGNLTFTNNRQGSWTVLSGSYRWTKNDCGSACFVKTEVTNAAGDGYQYRFLSR